MRKGFMFVLDALLALTLIALLSSGIAFSVNASGNEINSALIASVEARDRAVIGIHQQAESESGTGYYSRVCFTAVKNNAETTYCRVIK
ncbi:MAG: hypothetical protein ABIA76_03200 [Candidatus Diapherotrites archaeon]